MPDRPLADFSFKPGVLSKISDAGFRLRLRREFSRNSYARLLYGTWHPTATGSILELKTGLHPLVLAFTVVWFGGVILIGGSLFVLGLLQLFSGAHEEGMGQTLVLVLMFPLLMFVGLLLVRSGQGDGLQLLEFTKSLLMASPVDGRAA